MGGTKIAIIGHGELGRALGQILEKKIEASGLNNYQISFWDKREEGSLPEVVAGADFILLCVPSWCVKEALAFLKPYCSRHAVVVLFSKGIDQATAKLPYEIAKKLLPTNVDFAVVSGAMIAEEIGTGKFGACLVASKSLATSERVTELFLGTNIMASVSKDIKGVAWSGVLKNIYALGISLAEGLDWTINERGLLFGQSVTEILTVLKLLGGKKETFLAPPLIADFVATSFDRNSANHQAGWELGRLGETTKQSEGLMSLPPLLDRLGTKAEAFPILQNLAKIAIAHADPKKVFGRF